VIGSLAHICMADASPAPLRPDVDLEEDGVTPRHGSRLYTTQQYWDYRYRSREAGGEGDSSYEWLASWEVVRGVIDALLPDKDARVLLVGCGTSRLGVDMHEAGYRNVVQSDYSDECLRSMSSQFPHVPYIRADMLKLEADLHEALGEEELFDAVIDKAAMDALLAAKGDTWDPPEDLLDIARTICAQTVRVLRPGGLYLQISFAQPHFRRKYLEQEPSVWAAACKVHSIDAGFGYFAYELYAPESTRGLSPPAAQLRERVELE
jgi:EEF1A lysine methyltransferase 4